MRRTEQRQGLRMLKLRDVSSRWEAGSSSQREAAELLGTRERRFRRWRVAARSGRSARSRTVRLLMDDPDREGVAFHTTVDGDHGRIETRTATVSTDIDWPKDHHQRPGPMAIGNIMRGRETATKTASETACYPLGTPMGPERFAEVVREHWGVENRLHRGLDVTMSEDQLCDRRDTGPENLAVLRHPALDTVTKEASPMSRRRKLRRAGMNDHLLRSFLTRT